MVRKNMNYAYTDKGGLYKWGHFPSGLNLTPNDETIDIPKKDKELQGYAFKKITLSKDSAVAIGRSVVLNFDFPENERPGEKSTNAKFMSF